MIEMKKTNIRKLKQKELKSRKDSRLNKMLLRKRKQKKHKAERKLLKQNKINRSQMNKKGEVSRKRRMGFALICSGPRNGETRTPPPASCRAQTAGRRDSGGRTACRAGETPRGGGRLEGEDRRAGQSRRGAFDQGPEGAGGIRTDSYDGG